MLSTVNQHHGYVINNLQVYLFILVSSSVPWTKSDTWQVEKLCSFTNESTIFVWQTSLKYEWTFVSTMKEKEKGRKYW